MGQSRNLNIHYTAPDYVWEELHKIYESMPNWKGYIDGFPYWFGHENEEKYITASVEPSGLQIFGDIEQEEFEEWLELLKNKLSDALGYEIGEPEDGFKFKFYD